MNQDVRILFHELADLSPGDRERIFREREIGSEVRAEVESLLGFDSAPHQDLTDRVSSAAQKLLQSAASRELEACGPYRLLRLIGSGGMGAVYLAERTDGEIQQRVAIKLLGLEIHGQVTRDRFLKERQLLASLQHPSIVHVLDAGHTADGRPYLVMEFIEGVPIDAYSARLGVREKLKLFLHVCDAISHAHRHLIIHRDLKPSNILVDADGRPKVLDFGIAKLLDDSGDATRTVERLLTPNYASPEQLRGTMQSTATDVYSLGAVLYKLLTDRSPHESDSHTSQAWDVITGSREVPVPSRLNPSVPKDVDSILQKALRLEPEERYASVEALANDIQAFLESRPVQARSGNSWYRTRKFLRRYWMPATAAALVIASLSAGLYVANRERVIAQRRFNLLRQLARKVFEVDNSISMLPGATQARQRLAAASLEYLEGLAPDARGDLDLAQEIAQGYAQLGSALGVPTAQNLGEPAKAEETLKKADALIDTVLASRPQNRGAQFRSAIIAHDRMILAQQENRRSDAVAFARKSASRFDTTLRLAEGSESERSEIAGRFGNIALVHVNLHLYADAVPYARRSLELARGLPSDRYRYRVGQALSMLAIALRYQGDLDGALQAIEEARKVVEKATYANETQRMFGEYGVRLRQGLILGEDGAVSLGRPDDALEPIQSAFDLVEQAARKDPNDATSRSRVGDAGIRLANIQLHRDPLLALATYDLVIRRLGEIRNSPEARRSQAQALAKSSYALCSLHRAPEAKQRIDAAFAILKETHNYPADRIPLDSETFDVVSASADHEAAQSNPRRAIEIYEELLMKVTAAQPEPFPDLPDAPRLSGIYAALATLYGRVGDSVKAGSMQAKRTELWQSWDRKLPQNSFVRRQLAAVRLP